MKTLCVFLVAIIAIAYGKTFTKCSLAQTLVSDGVARGEVHHYPYIVTVDNHPIKVSRLTKELNKMVSLGVIIWQMYREDIIYEYVLIEKHGQVNSRPNVFNGTIIGVCMAQAESGLSTTASNVNTDGSADHGIFQINDYWNCKPSNGRASKNGCGHPCSDFENSNLSDDVACIKQNLIWHHHDYSGFSYGYRARCKGVTASYLSGCSY